MILGYNTNGLAHHDLFDAVELLAEIGYRGVAITLDHGVLNPFSHGFESQAKRLRQLADKHQLSYVIETGARYLLDPRTKHEPTLVSPKEQARAKRIDFLRRSMDAAERIGTRCVSLWAGVVHDGVERLVATQRLVESMKTVLEVAASRGITLAFEPEPGMLIETLADYAELKRRIADTGANVDPLMLTVDIGHLHCLGETPIAQQLEKYAGEIANVHIEDMQHGVHEHLQFGDGEIDFPPIIAALKSIGYDGPLNVELSRHSHDAPIAARRAHHFLQQLLNHG